jgi:uncharacterized protein YndB with AHSA1/START domain
MSGFDHTPDAVVIERTFDTSVEVIWRMWTEAGAGHETG